MTGSEPAYRNQKHPEANKQARPHSHAEPKIIVHSPKKGGVDPVLFNKLGQVRRGEISRGEVDYPSPVSEQMVQAAILDSAQALQAQNSEIQALQAQCSAIQKSIDALQALSKKFLYDQGITELHYSIHRRDEKAVRELLAAGADPGSCSEDSISPLSMALTYWPEIALTLAEALPDGAHANPEENGNTEVHLAVHHPEVLYVLLSKGMSDSANNKGVTALMRASKEGELLSVKYLLGKPFGNGGDNDLSRYLNQREFIHGGNALACACSHNHGRIAEILVRHGADLYQHPDRMSLVSWAVKFRNADLLRLLLAEGAAVYETDLPTLLVRATRRGWTKGVEALVKFVSLTDAQQHKLMKQWLSTPMSETLAAISPLISLKNPSVHELMLKPALLQAPFDADSPELLHAMLEFFDRRDSFSYVIQSFISHLIDDVGDVIEADMARTLLRFVLPRFSRLNKDKETVMRLLQLSEKLKDYTLITEITALNASGHWLARKKIPFNRKWISDPVSLEFLRLKEHSKSMAEYSDPFAMLVATLRAPDEMLAIDGAQLSNDLIFALKSDAVGNELDKTFDDHRMSAIVRQVLKPLLQGLVTQLYPDPSTRVDAVCRILIGYAFSRLADDPRLTQQPAFELIQTNPQWQKMKQKMEAEIESIENVAATIVDTMRSEILGASLPDVVASLTMEAMNKVSMETNLTAAFRSRLGLLDAPAHQLARACESASRIWQASSASSTTASESSTHNTPEALKALIRQAFVAQKRAPSLPEEFLKVSLKIDSELVDDFNNLVWWQMDLLAVALGIDEHAPDEQSSDKVYGSSGESPYAVENEKS